MTINDAGWYVLQVNPNCEKKATAELRRAGFRVYLPRSAKEVTHKRTKERSVKRRPLMCGYVFLRFPDHVYDRRGVPPFALVRACQGVRDFLKAINERNEWEPFAIPSKLVAALMRRERGREFGRPALDRPEARRARLREKYPKGRQMVVADGPFEAFLATVERLTDAGAVEAEVTIFGRPTKVTFDNPEQTLRAVEREAA